MYISDEDGVTHVNIYSKGKTDLGRFLSNFAYAPIMVQNRTYNSLEAYWYCISLPTSVSTESLRFRDGYKAKEDGKSLIEKYGKGDLSEEEFRQKMKFAMSVKIRTYPRYLTMLRANELPLAHYYVYGGKSVDAGYSWIVDEWTRIRSKAIELGMGLGPLPE